MYGFMYMCVYIYIYIRVLYGFVKMILPDLHVFDWNFSIFRQTKGEYILLSRNIGCHQQNSRIWCDWIYCKAAKPEIFSVLFVCASHNWDLACCSQDKWMKGTTYEQSRQESWSQETIMKSLPANTGRQLL